MTAFTYLESQGDNGECLGDGTASLQGQTQRRTMLLQNLGAGVMPTVIGEILGSTSDRVSGTGRLTRTMPLADAEYPYMMAKRIVSIKGVGQTGPTQATAQAQLEVPTFAKYAFFNNYLITIDFDQRPYPVADNPTIQQQQGSWKNFAGNTQTFNYVPEWTRWLDWSLELKSEAATAVQCGMAFQSGGAGGPPSKTVFDGHPNMYLPDGVAVFVWYEVPYRYITSSNSYLLNTANDRNWMGCINQNAWFGFPVGSLMWVGLKWMKYSPPGGFLTKVGAIGAQTTTQKLADITLTCLYTSRQLQVGETGGTITNPNWVANGWNLLPWLADRKFHYAQSLKQGTIPSTPPFYSFPMELLFMDPDFTQPQTLGNNN